MLKIFHFMFAPREIKPFCILYCAKWTILHSIPHLRRSTEQWQHNGKQTHSVRDLLHAANQLNKQSVCKNARRWNVFKPPAHIAYHWRSAALQRRKKNHQKCTYSTVLKMITGNGKTHIKTECSTNNWKWFLSFEIWEATVNFMHTSLESCTQPYTGPILASLWLAAAAKVKRCEGLEKVTLFGECANQWIGKLQM